MCAKQKTPLSLCRSVNDLQLLAQNQLGNRGSGLFTGQDGREFSPLILDLVENKKQNKTKGSDMGLTSTNGALKVRSSSDQKNLHPLARLTASVGFTFNLVSVRLVSLQPWPRT